MPSLNSKAVSLIIPALVFVTAIKIDASYLKFR